jgi:hypothetical protein
LIGKQSAASTRILDGDDAREIDHARLGGDFVRVLTVDIGNRDRALRI